MIGYIKGSVEYIGVDTIILECNNIGYRIFVPSSYQNGLISLGEEIKLFTYMNVREDAINLFGFLNKDDLDAYLMLLGVNGVGPKAALGILSYMNSDSLKLAIITDDAASISKAPGIGKKTASKIILELKDKLKIEDVIKMPSEEDNISAVDSDSLSDAIMALVALGYTNSEAVKAARKAAKETGSADTEEIIKVSLKYLF